MSTTRSEQYWIIHNSVIQSLKNKLETDGKYVVINPGTEENQGGHIKRDGKYFYPDVIVRPIKGSKISEIYEIETEDTVDETEAEQWKIFNEGSSDFYLVLPENSVNKTMAIINSKGFEIKDYFFYDDSCNVHHAL